MANQTQNCVFLGTPCRSLATLAESMDISVPASVTVWQLPSTEPVLKQQMECSLSLPPVPRVVTTPDVPAIPSVPKNTPVSQVSHVPSLAMPPPPSVSVSCVLCPELGQSQHITGGQWTSPGGPGL